MELAKALIMTNVLGGFSSLGRAGAVRTTGRGGFLVELSGYTFEVLCSQGRIEVSPCLPRGTALDGLEPLLEEWMRGLIPARVIVWSYHEAVAWYLSVDGDRLVAEGEVPSGPLLLTLELTFYGAQLRSEPILISTFPPTWQ